MTERRRRLIWWLTVAGALGFLAFVGLGREPLAAGGGPGGAWMADATPQAGPFLELWVAIAFLAGVAANLVTLIKVNQKQKREVSFSFEPASKMEFERHVESNRQEHAQLATKLSGVERGWAEKLGVVEHGLAREMQEMERRLNAADEERTHALHNRVNEILGEMREIRGELRGGRVDRK